MPVAAGSRFRADVHGRRTFRFFERPLDCLADGEGAWGEVSGRCFHGVHFMAKYKTITMMVVKSRPMPTIMTSSLASDFVALGSGKRSLAKASTDSMGASVTCRSGGYAVRGFRAIDRHRYGCGS